MIRTVIWFVYFWAYLVYLIPSLFKVKRYDNNNMVDKRDKLVDEVVHRWARSLVKLSGSIVKITGEQNVPESGAVLFVANHQGNFDIPILLGFIKKPKSVIAKIEMKRMPMISTWMKYMNCIFMDRKDIRQSLKVINEGAEYLKKGYSILVFPEGTRSKGTSIGEFKKGSLKLALKSGVPIIPITIKGSYKIMEQNGFIIKPAEVEVIISEPIETFNISKKEAEELPDKVKNIVMSNL
jgi:1-acyl-sn-glycerol-3-phosphate acyltransferase